MFNWQDMDGTATQQAGRMATPVIVGGWPSWWQLSSSCVYEVRR